LPTLYALIAGSLGGLVAAYLHLPAPWLAGSMLAVIAVAYTRIPVAIPNLLKAAAFILLGIQTGTTVKWETVERASQWPLSIAGLALTVAAVTASCFLYYRRGFGWDKQTSLFVSLPGALSLVILLAEDSSADMKKVVVGQCVRLLFIIAALPAAIEFLNGSNATVQTAAAQIGSVIEIAILIATATLAGLAFEKLRVPAGLILGAALAAATLVLSGNVQGAAPDAILIPANIVLGSMIAVRFAAINFAELRTYFAASLGGFVLAMAVAAAGAALTSWLGGLPLPLTLLAFAPGGLEAMIIMAFALGLDPAYVAAHQIARYVGLVLLMPFVTGAIIGRTHRNVSVNTDASRLEDG
jgi:hypothetical protein